jgi:hypothetical protein
MPIHHSAYDTKWQVDFSRLDEIAESNVKKGEARYDARSKLLTPLRVGLPVIIQDCSGVTPHRWTIKGEIQEILEKGQYLIRLPSGRVIRRSRVHIRVRQLVVGPSTSPEQASKGNVPMTEENQEATEDAAANNQGQRQPKERRSSSVPTRDLSTRLKKANRMLDPQVWDLKQKRMSTQSIANRP